MLMLTRPLPASWLALLLLLTPALLGNEAATRPSDMSPRLWRQLTQLDQALSDVRDMTADFTRLKHTPLLKEPLTAKGTVAVQGQKVRWQTTEPTRTVTLAADGEIRIYQPHQKHLEIYPLRRRFAQFGASPVPRMTVLAKQFKVKKVSATKLFENISIKKSADRYLALRLTPRDGELRQRLQNLVLLLDRKQRHITRMRLHFSDDEWTAYRFSNVKLNVGLAEDRFELNLPADVEISRPMEGDAP